MDTVLLALKEELNSSVFVLLVLLCMVLYLVYRAGGLVEKFKSHEEKLDEARGIRHEVIAIKTKVDLIYQNTNPNALYTTRSPLMLTQKGDQVAQALSANEILERLMDKLRPAIEKESPGTAYDIQVAAQMVAHDHLLGLLKDKEVSALKEQAFKQGAPLDDILGVFGIMLRDRILSERGIPLSEVDISEPPQPTSK